MTEDINLDGLLVDPRIWMNEELDALRGERDRVREENEHLRSLLREEGFSDKDIERLIRNPGPKESE